MATPDKGNQRRDRKGGSATERLKNLRGALGKSGELPEGGAPASAPQPAKAITAPKRPSEPSVVEAGSARAAEAAGRPSAPRGTLVRSMMARMDTPASAPDTPKRSAVVERKPKPRTEAEKPARSQPRSAPAVAEAPAKPRRATQPQIGGARPAAPVAAPQPPPTARAAPSRPDVAERLARVGAAVRARPAEAGRPRPAPVPEPPRAAPTPAPEPEPLRAEPEEPDTAKLEAAFSVEAVETARRPSLADSAAEIPFGYRKDEWTGDAKPVYADGISLPDAPPAIAPPQSDSGALEPKKTPAFAGFEWNIAARYLRARRKEGFISVIAGFSLVGIALGVATLIIVMSVMTGFRETLIDQILGVDPHINVVTQQDRPFDDYDPMATALANVPGVTAIWPSVEGQVLASSATSHSGVIVRGVRREDMMNLRIVTEPEASVGSVENFVKDNGIAIGEGVARKLGIRLGDSVTLVSPDGDLTPFGVTPRSKSYPVIYIYKLGLSHYDSAFAYMPLEEAQLYFNKKGVVDSLNVLTENASEIETFEQPIRQAARRSVGILTWKDRQGSLIGALDVERNVMFLILTLIILVAALNIISGLVMLVKDKARDVAIMRTMGMSRGSILRIFFICGASIGVVGAVVGTVLGVLFCLNIGAIQAAVESVTGPVFPAEVYGLSGLPARLQTGDVLLTLGIALSLSFLATLYPAWKAAKLDPVEALRYE